MEKVTEHQAKQFLLFVHLKKAYDSVSCKALWCALEKLGVPDLVIDIIWSFHEDVKAKVCINGELLAEDINVVSGLRQGCTVAPVLFNLYACLVFEWWSSELLTWTELEPSYCIRLTRSSSEGPPGMIARVN